MHWEDVRRITGRHPLLPVAGAGMELISDGPAQARHDEVARVTARIIEAWSCLDWPTPDVRLRHHAQGVSLAVSAPPHQLYAAADALEWASLEEPLSPDALHDAAREEDRPMLAALLARASDFPVFYDDDEATVGLGKFATTWPLDEIPAEISAPSQRIPFVYITGTNGKTTTTRLLSHLCATAGLTPGHTSSDGVVIGGDWVTRGDWTGPGAARHVLRHPDVDVALLETARGGLMRRGLVLEGADAAAVTNISDDHLGEWGLLTLDDMAWAKLTVAYGVKQGGTLVVSTGHGPLDRAVQEVIAQRPDLQVRRISATHPDEALDGWLEDDALWLRVDGAPTRLAATHEIPVTMDGAAVHNIDNALTASWLALAAGVSLDHVTAGLKSFRPSVEQSRGRLNRFRLASGGTALLDFAHNPDAVRRMATIARRWDGHHVSFVTGQAGDREDALLIGLARAIAHVRPSRVMLKEMTKYLRGREPGETLAILRTALVAEGYAHEAIEDFETEIEATRRALELTGPDDLAIVIVHEDLDAVLALLAELGASEWAIEGT